MRLSGWLRRPAAWAWLSGVLVWLGFPGPSLWWLTPWMGLVPLLAAAQGVRPARAALLGWQTGCLCCGLTLLWLLGLIPIAGVIAALGFGALVPWLAVYWGAAAAVTSWVARRWPAAVVLVFPGIWVCMEWLSNHAFTGFGWVLLGYTQGDNLALMQLASVGGVYGVSFVIALVNVLLWFAAASGGTRTGRIAAIAAAIVVLVGTHAFGSMRLRDPARAGDPLRVGIVQGSFSTEVKWDSRYADVMWDQQVHQSIEALQAGADVVLWSESALGLDPFQRWTEPVKELVRQLGVPLVLGSNHFQVDADGYVRRVTNGAFAVHPDGRVDGPYEKRHLTPFGEYTPLQWLLPFLNKMIPAISDFDPGSDNVALELDGALAQPIICFESVFPHEVRAAANDSQADVLLHLTNVGWFGRSIMPEQDLAVARFRAVELGVPMVRAANVGISCIIDAHGRFVDVAHSGSRRVFVVETLVGDVVPGRVATLYARWGDGFVLLCAIATVATLALCYTRAPRPT